MADRRHALRALYDLLQRHEGSGQGLAPADILSATGWKPSTLRTYENKGLFAAMLDRRDDGSFSVVGVSAMSFDAFRRRTTQSQYLRDVAHAAREPLARALLKKAAENMTLALEVFNRPSLENRLDAFVLLFCCAWEQLLKAKVVEERGEEAIFKAPQPNRHRETVSLGECLSARPSADPVRRNLEQIKYLRDRATHLLMPELQSVTARLFQAGILNFAKEYELFAKVSFLPATPLGLFTLVGEVTRPTVVRLQGRYGGATGKEILDLFNSLSDNITEQQDQRFAIPLDYRLVFTKDAADADIQLNPTGSGPGAMIIEKPRNVEDTHPLTPEDVVARTDASLRDRFPVGNDLAKRLVGRKGGLPVFNTHDLQAVVHREGWRRTNTALHHVIRRKKMELHCYAEAVVEEIVRRIVGDSDYLRRARESYSHHLKSAKGRKPPGRSG